MKNNLAILSLSAALFAISCIGCLKVVVTVIVPGENSQFEGHFAQEKPVDVAPTLDVDPSVIP